MKAVKNLKLALVGAAFLSSTSAQAAVIQFDYSGAIQQRVTLNNVTEVTLRAWSARGQSNADDNADSSDSDNSIDGGATDERIDGIGLAGLLFGLGLSSFFIMRIRKADQ